MKGYVSVFLSFRGKLWHSWLVFYYIFASSLLFLIWINLSWSGDHFEHRKENYFCFLKALWNCYEYMFPETHRLKPISNLSLFLEKMFSGSWFFRPTKLDYHNRTGHAPSMHLNHFYFLCIQNEIRKFNEAVFPQNATLFKILLRLCFREFWNEVLSHWSIYNLKKTCFLVKLKYYDLNLSSSSPIWEKKNIKFSYGILWHHLFFPLKVQPVQV